MKNQIHSPPRIQRCIVVSKVAREATYLWLHNGDLGITNQAEYPYIFLFLQIRHHLVSKFPVPLGEQTGTSRTAGWANPRGFLTAKKDSILVAHGQVLTNEHPKYTPSELDKQNPARKQAALLYNRTALAYFPWPYVIYTMERPEIASPRSEIVGRKCFFQRKQ